MNASVKTSAWTHSGPDDICVVGLGARTAVGASAPASAAAVRGGVSGVSLHKQFKDEDGEPVTFAADPVIDPDAPIAQRMAEMLRAAGEEALGDAAADSSACPDCCVLALPEPRAGLPSEIGSLLAAEQARHLGLSPDSVRTIARGHAGGLMAMQAAARWLARGDVQSVLVLGVDSYRDAGTLRSLEIRRRLKCSHVRGGFTPGEAAGAVLLTRRSVAERADLVIFSRIRAVATAVEPHPLRATEPCVGEGLTAAIAAATANLRLPAEEIALTYCDLNGERFRNEEFMFAQLRTQEAFIDANDYVSPADCWGDVGAASGPLYVALAAATRLRGYARGDHAMLWTGSDAGYRAALTLKLG
ncbi:MULTISPECIES: hypothetical protein [Caballeronia]|uniref:3-oxoacyl-ACP synthase n=1 Tax=Caballeronia jiangsuensis TaxID=1458357 RepID=A0ABW9CSY8_9BURK|nr:hypothetical protein [Caballeronia sp. GaOx3]